MVRYKKDYAQHIKAKLADYILSSFDMSEIVLATEVPVAGKKSIIDMMVISEDRLFGYEIKSNFDSASRLSMQMQNYIDSFNGLYLVLGQQNNAKYKKYESSGILLYKDNNIHHIRKARIRKFPAKENMIDFLWKSDLVSNANDRNLSVEILKEMALKKMTREQLLKKVTFSLRERYKERYQLFLQSRGEKTCVQDIDILTMRNDYLYLI